MFLRRTERKKDGKVHSYWSIVENKRVSGGRMVQRHVLYLGEINSSQAAAWRKAIEVFDEDAGQTRTLSLFAEDGGAAVGAVDASVQVRLSALRLCRPRQWGACWLGGQLWHELQLDLFWAERLPPSRKNTRWDEILQVLVCYRLIAPGSEWRLHREWFGNSAMADLLGEMRASDPPVQYIVGTPKGRLNRLEKHLLDKPWQEARQGVQVKLLAEDGELYVFAQSLDRVTKERAMRRRQMKGLWKRLRQIAAMELSREELLMKLGAARSKAPSAWRLVEVVTDKHTAAFTFSLDRKKLRTVRRREGRYLLRTNLTDNDPALLWQYYIQLVAVEEAFRNLKGDLAIRPIFHQGEKRIEAHIFIAFLAYCLHVTLTRRLQALAPGLTARSALEKFAAVQMIDVHLPTTDGREIVLTRYTQPEPELKLLIGRLKLQLPPQQPPKITSAELLHATRL
jgi:hypothetical protein